MTERPEQRPEGRLIAAATKGSPLSVREAAAEVGISEGRWYQIVRGYQTISSGVYAPVKGPPDTLAKMARAVGVTAEELEKAERPDAAEELRTLKGRDALNAGTTAPASLADLPADPGERVAALTDRLERNEAETQALGEERRLIAAELGRLLGRPNGDGRREDEQRRSG